MNEVDPQAWLADVLARIAEIPKKSTARTAAVGMENRSKYQESCLTAALGVGLRLTPIREPSNRTQPIPRNGDVHIVSSVDCVAYPGVNSSFDRDLTFLATRYIA